MKQEHSNASNWFDELGSESLELVLPRIFCEDVDECRYRLGMIEMERQVEMEAEQVVVQCTQDLTYPLSFHNLGAGMYTVMQLSMRHRIQMFAEDVWSVTTGDERHLLRTLLVCYLALCFFLMSVLILTTFIAIVRVAFSKASNEVRSVQQREPSRKKVTSDDSLASLQSVHQVKLSRSMSKKQSLPMKNKKSQASKQTWQALIKRCLHLALQKGSTMVQRLGDSRSFRSSVQVVISLNVLLMATKHRGQSDQWTVFLATAELWFTIFFVFELCMQCIVHKGLVSFLHHSEQSHWNQLDFLIVSVSALDIVFSMANVQLINISFLRTLRLFRVLRILQNSQAFMKIVHGFARSFSRLMLTTMFGLLVLTSFAVVSLLMGRLIPSQEFEEAIDSQMDIFLFAGNMLTVFVAVSGNSFFSIYEENSKHWNGWINTISGSVFFITLVLSVSFVCLNFVVIVLMTGFGLSKERAEELRQQRRETAKQSFLMEVTEQDPAFFKAIEAVAALSVTNPLNKHSHEDKDHRKTGLRARLRVFLLTRGLVSSGRLEHSFLLFHPEHLLRKKMKAVVKNELFHACITLCIIYGSLLPVLKKPGEDEEIWMMISNDALLLVFSAEMVMKALADGFLLPEKSYLSSAYNKLDFLILLAMYLEAVLALLNTGSSSFGMILKMFRLFRPLRLISKMGRLRIVLEALAKSLRPVFYTFAFLWLIIFMFALIALDLFTDFDVVDRQSSSWLENLYFENTLDSMFLLFEVMSLKNWTEKLWSSIATSSSSPFTVVVYYVLFLLLSNFILLKIFMGLIVGYFREFSGYALSTDEHIIFQYLNSHAFSRRNDGNAASVSSNWYEGLNRMTAAALNVLLLVAGIFFGIGARESLVLFSMVLTVAWVHCLLCFLQNKNKCQSVKRAFLAELIFISVASFLWLCQVPEATCLGVLLFRLLLPHDLLLLAKLLDLKQVVASLQVIKRTFGRLVGVSFIFLLVLYIYVSQCVLLLLHCSVHL